MKLEQIIKNIEKIVPILDKIEPIYRKIKSHRTVGIPIWNKEMESYAKQLRKEGYSFGYIANELGVGRSTVFDHLSPKGRYYKGLRRFIRR